MAYNIKMPLICHDLLAFKMQYNVKSLCLMPCSVTAQNCCWAVVLIDTGSGRGTSGTLNVLLSIAQVAHLNDLQLIVVDY